MFLKNQMYAIGLMLVLTVAIVYWQYRLYRMPITHVAESTIANEIVSGGPGVKDIPAIQEPAFESVVSADQYLDDRGLGIAFEINGRARFYPFQILVWHEVVNDVFMSQPVLVTYSPLTGAGMIFDRTVSGSAKMFSFSGKLYNNDHLLQDVSTKTLWSPLLRKAIHGEREGSVLIQRPSHIISWDAFKKNYPAGSVLSRKTGFVRDYTRNPYAMYDQSHAVYSPISHDDSRLPTKTMVFGGFASEEAFAVSEQTLQDKQVMNIQIDTISVVLMWNEELQTGRGYSAMDSSGNRLTFKLDNGRLIDEATGSVWNVDELESLILTRTYWFAWSAMYPQTELSV